MYVLRYENGQKYDAHADACAQVKGVAGTEACRWGSIREKTLQEARKSTK